MKKLIAIAIAGFVATAAQAGDKPVIISIHEEVPVIYYTYSNPMPVDGVKSVSSGIATQAKTSRGTVGQNGNGLNNQEVLYARLLEEAQKRGLR